MIAAELDVLDWFHRLAEATGAFSVQQAEVPAPGHYVGGWTADIALEIRPTSEPISLRLEVEVRSRITPAEALATLERMKTARSDGLRVLCAPAISERVAEMCRERGISYLDEAGNCRITGPGLFIQIHGYPNVRPDTRPAVDVFAAKSSRIARILLTHPSRGWQVQALASEAKVSLGLASKVKQALLEQAYAEERDSLLYPRQAEQLLREWAKRGPNARPRPVGLFTLDKHQVAEQRVREWCHSHSTRCALTQFSGAWRLAPMVRYSRSTIYVEGAEATRQLTADLGLKPVSSGANLVIWPAVDPFVFYDVRDVDGVQVASPIQLYLDLAGEQGRGEEAAEQILAKEVRPTW